MKLRDFRVGVRILAENPAYSLVAVLGLGVGMAVCLLLLGYVRYSWQYNVHIPDVENVYIVKQRRNTAVGAPWYDDAPVLLRNVANTLPGVTQSSGYATWFPLTANVDGKLTKLRNITALPGFEKMIGLHAIKGDLTEALSRPDCFAITEKTAIRLFGTTDALGRTAVLKSAEAPTGLARVAAIVPDPPANSTIRFETLIGLNLRIIPRFMGAEGLSGNLGFPGNVLIRVRKDASLAVITEALQHAVDEMPVLQKISPETKAALGDRKVVDIKLTRLRDAYFDREVALHEWSLKVDRGNETVVAGLAAIAILILALAAINYVNLATIRVVRRQREIAIRKVLGVSRYRLVLQFAAESLLVSLSATAIGLLMAYLALPAVGELMNRDLTSLLSLENLAVALAMGVGLGLLTAIYPAWIALGVRPSHMLVGRTDTESPASKHLRQALSVLQVAVAMGLASITLAIYWQTLFAMNASPGFDPAHLLVFELNEGIVVGEKQKYGLITALSQQPGVAGVAVSNEAVGRGNDLVSALVKREGGRSVTADLKSVSSNFFEQYGIKPLAGRLFDSKVDREDDIVPLVINAVTARALGFASPEQAVGQTVLVRLDGLVTKRIVGVAPEIRFNSLREAPRAMAYDMNTEGVTLTVRASGSLADAERAVRTVWPQFFPNSVLVVTPSKDIYAANYADDARLARLLAFSTVIAMLIAAFGVYVLAADAVQRRTKEIALRKLFGTRSRDIGKLVAKDVGAIILVAAIIAIPVAAIAIARYLAIYTEQTPLAFWSLAIAVAAAVVTASLAAARQTWIAMVLKPAVALRT
ncbi:MAG: putative transport system permease protein [Gammaproteobacteria bacterium]|nr:putative transport system permease protein [Gammaproteobacteria bacterium]